MRAIIRYTVLVLVVTISLLTTITFMHEGFCNATSFLALKRTGTGSLNPNTVTTLSPPRRANATFVLLARNSDLDGIVISMKQIEDRFNKKFGYPYVFLNEEPFTDDFKRHITELTDAEVKFGLIPREHWFQPEWIDEGKAAAAREKMVTKQVLYGGSVPYRNMCRFNSGFFWRNELLEEYKYYWRWGALYILSGFPSHVGLASIRPDVKFFCDLDYDPFLVMEDQKKVYAFTITFPEFIKEYPRYIEPDNSLDFLSDDGGETYNLVWSNFEIGDLEFWRGEAYGQFFDFLDKKGGFYYERWGDAPVHSMGVALLARRDQIVRGILRLSPPLLTGDPSV
ncbi:hypothetical protein V5O48_007790 [Marasmius crinis-equi]|uniref:Glycosyltransferase family 15 protein n=1 Tax=Marasmius crinis-equi TaxID=585013 RepID=A0ABR3FFN2_9AGAR